MYCTADQSLLNTFPDGGCGSMVECGLPKAETRVRFPSPAPISETVPNEMSVFSARKSHRHRPKDEKERFYLLPGQGGSSYRRKQKFILKSAIVVGVVVSAILAAIMYFMYRPPR